jgi:cytochrome b561
MRNPAQFPAFSRLLHWLMAMMVLAMLFIGVGMAASVSERYHLLVSIHEPLGIAILVLVVIRFINRLLNPPPPLPAHLALWQRLAATMSLSALRADVPFCRWSAGRCSGRPLSHRALRAAASAAHPVP